MNKMAISMYERFRSDSGQDMLEYALLVALIAIATMSTLTATGSGVINVWFNNMATLAASI